MKSWQLVACVGALGLFGCGEKYKRDCSDVDIEVTYEVVQPVFETHCTRCHATDKVGGERDGAPAKVNYDSYEAAKQHAEEGDAQVAARAMPEDEPDAITDAEGCLIEAWIAQGYLR